ncbi:hypothetical protein HMI51_03320 [Corallococcus coralloides]|nr:hypothetical protein [Corallococcus coralloides]
MTRISSAVITTRHFGMPSHDSPRLPADELLRIAADVTGVPLEVMTDAQGREVQVWRPARGEVGWLPYDVPPANWTPPPPGYPA